jgi:hypothetical protein
MGAKAVTYAVSGILGAFLLALLVGALTGRVKASSCCSIADPRRDKRMQSAFEE